MGHVFALNFRNDPRGQDFQRHDAIDDVTSSEPQLKSHYGAEMVDSRARLVAPKIAL